MTNKEILKKQIIYRSTHRGSKEMDLLLGNFVKKNIDSLDIFELNTLIELMDIEDEILHKWYFHKIDDNKIPSNKISQMLKEFKI